MSAFGALLVLFVLALGVCLHGFWSISRAERAVEDFERARHAADRSSILMREQYIHQAHTLIAFDGSHLGHYREVAELAAQSIADLRGKLATNDDAPLVDDLERYVRESDRTFVERTVPAVLRGDRAEAVHLHEDMEASVTSFSKTVRQLHDRNDARAAGARADAEAAWDRARTASLACLGLAIVMAIALGVFMTRTVVSRIARLQAGAGRIGRGDLGARIGLDATDEIGDLARAFDAMAAALERSQGELMKNQKLAAMGQVAAGLAHELNNPLGVIVGYAKLLRMRDQGDPEALSVIEQEARLASDIVQSLLDLTRPQSLRVDDVDLGVVVRECVSRIGQREKLAGIHWGDARIDGDPVVRGDEARLRQVVVNLLSNAADAALPDGRVALAVEAEGERVRVVVDDSGKGISESDRGKVMEPFFTTKADGVGLGLAIVRAIIDAHHGSVELGDSPLGGARVVVTLPRSGGEGPS
ncbi:MAG: HAMP domain-containing histidine kinase [Polyangiaceae bacterium]|nr:HAMP domain-containing histidine kinase [Polyangiaceae bacterium]